MAHYKPWRSFEEAREFARSLGLRGSVEWGEFHKSDARPADIPSAPRRVYKDKWISWGDFLGTGYVATARRQYRTFEEAREFARSLGFGSEDEWLDYCRSGRKPTDVPAAPYGYYPDEWRTWGDWLGYRPGAWTRGALLALLSDLRAQLPYLEERELYAILQQAGAMQPLRRAFGGASPLAVLKAIREDDGEKLQAALQGGVPYAEPESEPLDDTLAATGVPSDEGLGLEQPQTDLDVRLPTLTLGHALHAVDEMAELAYGLDDEVAEYLVDNRVALLWERHINDGASAAANALTGEGGRYFDLIRSRFRAELEGVQSLEVPREWSFAVRDDHGQHEPRQPNTMQKRTAWAVLHKRRVGNWSGVGAGKTLSAVLASRVVGTSTTLVVTNKATVQGWCDQITAAFPDSVVATEPFPPVQGRFNYVVLNYEKFQQPNRNALVRELAELGPGFVVFDEVQLVKQREERTVSIRRRALEALVSMLAEHDPDLRVLGMSATPVINNLLEARKLLEIVTGRSHGDLAMQPTVDNALAVHRALMVNGFRYRPRYEIEMTQVPVEVNGNALLRELTNVSGVLALEQTLLPAKLEAITPYVRQGTLVYTHYVTGMVGPIRTYLERLGFKVGFYTGDDKSGLEAFKAGALDVLIGSKPVGTGLDGLQTVCDRIVMLSLPWTSAEYEQILGRVRRQGSAFGSVSEIVPQVVLDYGGDQWSWDKNREATIRYKRTLSDCAVDGNIPEAVRISETELLDRSREALEQWIERVEDKGMLVLDRAKLTIPLPPDVREKVIVKRGDFTAINNRWSTSNSATTHERLESDPSEWYLYHTLYREARAGWLELPAEHIASHLRARPDLKVGDFGCGECLLKAALPEHEVIGLDHVAVDVSVLACDIAHTPLQDESLGAAVFSLSLMGRNWSEYLKEAHRVLRPFGLLFVAEPARRWEEGRLERAVEECGFGMLPAYQRGDFRYIRAVKL